jgi:DNA-binding transcriptional ArsR family regulator
MDFLVRLFKGVSNETRIRILKRLLKEGEGSIESIAREIKLPYKTIEWNIKVLEKAGLVGRRTWGGVAYFSILDSTELKYNHAIFDMIRMNMKSKMK